MAAPSPVPGALQQVALAARDVDCSFALFRDRVGFEPIATVDSPDIALLRLGETGLLLERSESATPSSATLYLRVADIGAAHVELRSRGIEFEQPPHLIHMDEAGTFGAVDEEECMAFFKDPNGADLTLGAPMRDGAAAGHPPR